MASTVPACVIDVGTGWVLTTFENVKCATKILYWASWWEVIVNLSLCWVDFIMIEGWAEIFVFYHKMCLKVTISLWLRQIFFKLIEKFKFRNYLMIFQMGMKMNECSTSVIFNHEGWAEISGFFYQKRYWNLSVNLYYFSNW